MFNLEYTTQCLCVQCQETLTTHYLFNVAPPLLCFDVWHCATMELSRSMTINVSTRPLPVKYQLSSIIYFGQGHFTARYFSPSRSVLYHDGINGCDMVVDTVEHVNLRTCRGKMANLMLMMPTDSNSTYTSGCCLVFNASSICK